MINLNLRQHIEENREICCVFCVMKVFRSISNKENKTKTTVIYFNRKDQEEPFVTIVSRLLVKAEDMYDLSGRGYSVIGRRFKGVYLIEKFISLKESTYRQISEDNLSMIDEINKELKSNNVL